MFPVALLAAITTTTLTRPNTSWATVPVVYISGMKQRRSKEEFTYLAKYRIVITTKRETDGAVVNCTAPGCEHQERIQASVLAGVKAVNPNVFTGAYINSMLDFGVCSMAARYAAYPRLCVTNASSGLPATFTGDGPSTKNKTGVFAFDVSTAAGRAPWLDTVSWLVATGAVDSIFADKSEVSAGFGVCNRPDPNPDCVAHKSDPTFLCQDVCIDLGATGAAAFNAGKAALFAQAAALLPSKAIWLHKETASFYNGTTLYVPFRPTVKLVDYFVGLEGQYETVMAWVDDPGCPPNSAALNSTLAAFLLVAWKGMFLQCTPYGGGSGKSAWRTEYERALGPPLGPANRTGVVHTRTFASGTTVSYDFRTKVGQINWGGSTPIAGESGATP